MSNRFYGVAGRVAFTATLIAGLAAAGAASAQDASAKLDSFAKVQAVLEEQSKIIVRQQREIDELRAERDDRLSAIRAGSTGSPAGSRVALLQQIPNAVSEAPPVAPIVTAPAGPVGKRPVEEQQRQQREALAAVPSQLGVLTPKGRLILDPSIEYDRTSNDRLVFRGVEIVPGINLGLVEANRAARDTAVATLAARYGLTSRLEVEARVPYVYRNDHVTTVAAQSNNFQQNSSLYGHGIGDIEFAARYQLNYGANGWPIFVATTRLKPPTGKGPYDVAYDVNAVAQDLPTGSGFWGLEGGVTMLYPTDPAVIFGSLTYLHNFSRNVDKTFGAASSALHVGKVEPGDSIGAALGFGLSLNPRFSVSFGYSHNYIFKTTAFVGTLGATEIKSTSQPLQAGSLVMGWSFRLSDRFTLNNSFQFGVTSDAPDLQVVFRVPYRF